MAGVTFSIFQFSHVLKAGAGGGRRLNLNSVTKQTQFWPVCQHVSGSLEAQSTIFTLTQL